MLNTKQEVVDAIKAHFANVTTYAYAPGNRDVTGAIARCYYRSPEGYKCAIGCLIPDEMYDSKWDRSYSGGLSVNRVIEDGQISGIFNIDNYSVNWLRVIQNWHDHCAGTGAAISVFIDGLDHAVDVDRAWWI